MRKSARGGAFGDLVNSVRGALQQAQIGYTNLASKGGVVSVEIRDPAQVENARSLIEQAANGLNTPSMGPSSPQSTTRPLSINCAATPSTSRSKSFAAASTNLEPRSRSLHGRVAHRILVQVPATRIQTGSRRRLAQSPS